MNNNTKARVSNSIMAYAVGDALGLGTEFMTLSEVKAYYPGGLHDFSQLINDAHRCMWGHGNVTNDTYFVLLLARIIVRRGHISYDDFARGMKKWYSTSRYDIPQQLRRVLGRKDYLDDPYAAAQATWKDSGMKSETGSVLGVAAVAGMYSDTPVESGEKICSLLEAGPRARACSSIIALCANELLHKGSMPSPADLMDFSARFSCDIKPYITLAAEPDGIFKAEIDDEETYWWVRKNMCAALWAVWNAPDFEKGLVDVINCGGDADTNAALAGLMMALKFGAGCIPARWVDGLVDDSAIREEADAFGQFLASRN